jgi:hypothetical protein
MVSSFCVGPSPLHPLAHGITIVFFPFQSSWEGSRVRFFAAPRVAVYDPRRLVGLRGDPFFNQLVCRTVTHTAICRGDVVVSWPPLCILTWGVTPPTPICLAIQVGRKEGVFASSSSHWMQSNFSRSLSDIAVCDQAKKVRSDMRPQLWKNRRRIRWNIYMVRIFPGRARCRMVADRSPQ